MERGDACLTRRPLLEGAEEEVETPLPALPAGSTGTGPSRGARRQPEDRYALLQGGAALEEEAEAEEGAEGASDTEGLIAGAAAGGGTPAAAGSPATAGSGHFYECEDGSLDIAQEAESYVPPTPALAPVTPAASSRSPAAASALPPSLQPASEALRPPTQEAAEEDEVGGLSMRSDAVEEGPPRRSDVVIEMQSLGAQLEGAARPDDSELAGASEAHALAHRGRGGGDRHCFICLQEGCKENPLVRSCSTCYACTHVRCWRDWRNNQRITALRSRLLGLRMQTDNLLRCTICKSGTAVLAGEEDGLEWMNELLCGQETGNTGDEGNAANRLFGGALAPDSDEDGDAQLEDLVDMRTCFALMVYLGVLVLVLLVACTLIVMQQFYAGDVVLCCIIALYELSVLQIVALAVARRRSAMVLAAASEGWRDGNDVESQRGARELPLVQAP